MKYLLSLRVYRASIKNLGELGSMTKTMIIETPASVKPGVSLALALDMAVSRLAIEGLKFHSLNYAAHCEGPEMDAPVMHIMRGLRMDIERIQIMVHESSAMSGKSAPFDPELAECLAMAMKISEAMEQKFNERV